MKNITKLLSILALVAAVSYKTAYADLQAVREYQAEQNAGGQRAMAPRELSAIDREITRLKEERQQLNQKIRTANADLAAANRKLNEITPRIQERIQEFDKQLEAAYAWKAKTGDRKWDIGIDLITKSKQAAEQELATAKNQIATLEREKNYLQQDLQSRNTYLKDLQNEKKFLSISQQRNSELSKLFVPEYQRLQLMLQNKEIDQGTFNKKVRELIDKVLQILQTRDRKN